MVADKIAGAIALTFALLVLPGCGSIERGNLSADAGSGGVANSFKTGDRLSLGTVGLENQGPVRQDGGLELVGAQVAGHKAVSVPILDGGYPASSMDEEEFVDWKPLRGAILTPQGTGRSSATLVLGLKVHKTGLLRLTGVTINYREAGESHRTTTWARLYVCAVSTRKQANRGCANHPQDLKPE